MQLGEIGIWFRRQEAPDLAQVEALGYTTLWVGNSPSVAQARQFLERTTTAIVATGILNIWRHQPADVAAQRAEVAREFPGRFLLGIGVGHPESTSEYTKPLAAMRRFFDGLDAAEQPVPPEERVAAALGPKMLDLAAERSLGAHPYFTTPEHTREARERIGADALLAPEVAVVVDSNPETARATARDYAGTYLAASNYRRNLSRLGFSEDDMADGGSDRLIDSVIPHGAAGAVADAIRAHLDAGADHVCIQALGQSVDDYRALAAELL